MDTSTSQGDKWWSCSNRGMLWRAPHLHCGKGAKVHPAKHPFGCKAVCVVAISSSPVEAFVSVVREPQGPTPRGGASGGVCRPVVSLVTKAVPVAIVFHGLGSPRIPKASK